MIHAKLAAAMALWREQAAEAKYIARIAGGAIRRMLNRKLSMAWEQWQYVAAEMKRQERMLRRGIMRMLMRQLAAGLYTWREVAAQMKAERDALMYAAKDDGRCNPSYDLQTAFNGLGEVAGSV